MKTPLSWLKEWIDLPIKITTDELANQLLEHCFEIEEVIHLGKEITNVVVGKITSIDRHRDADKLVVCQITTGNESVQIVTGATNVEAGHVIPVALDGATLPHGMKIKTAPLRGVMSQGMLWSERELGLADEAQGIMILPDTTPLGIPIVDALNLNDPIIDLAILPNRGDLASIQGVAREISTLYDLPLSHPVTYTQNPKGNKDALTVINEAPDRCQRYMGALIRGVKIAPSPAWMQQRLQQVGIKSINNIVDITNYVMIELGQPLHAFDQSLITNSTLIIRNAKDNEVMTLLSEDNLNLSPDNLVIADASRPVALAGIMGGKFSGISDDTTDIILESAFFDPVIIRKTAFIKGLRTESSQRFEKGVDWTTVETALRRAIHLILEHAGGTVASSIIDIQSTPPKPVTIPFRPAYINQLLGTSLATTEMTRILSRLGFLIEEHQVIAPTWRQVDVHREADLAEEIGRFYGYNNINAVLPPITDFSGACNPTTYYALNDELRELLRSQGAREIVSYSMGRPDEPETVYNAPTVVIKNPLSQSESTLRPSLFVSLINNLAYNTRHFEPTIKAFELGRVFSQRANGTLDESWRAGMIWSRTSTDVSLLEMKAVLEDILKQIGIKKWQLAANTAHPYLHPHRSFEVRVGKEVLAIVGEVHPKLLKPYHLRTRPLYMELFTESLVKYRSTKVAFKSFAITPTVRRDISFWIDKTIPFASVLDVIEKTKAPFLKEVILCDIYDGKKYGDNKINWAISLVFQDENALGDDQVNASFEPIIKAIQEKLPIIFA